MLIGANTPTGTRCKGVYALVWIIRITGVLITEYMTRLVLFMGNRHSKLASIGGLI